MFDFGIGFPELMMIAIVALIVVGPKDLPKLLKTLGQYVSKIKNMASEFQTHIDDAVQESGVSDIKNQMQDELGDAADFDFDADFKKQEAELTKVFESAAGSPADTPIKSKAKKPAKKATKKAVKKAGPKAAKKPVKKASKKVVRKPTKKPAKKPAKKA